MALWVGVAECWCPSGGGTRLVCCEEHLGSVGTLSGCVVKRLESASVPAWGRWNESVSHIVYPSMTADIFSGIPALPITRWLLSIRGRCMKFYLPIMSNVIYQT